VLQGLQEIGVQLFGGIVLPFDFDRAGHAADPVQFGLGAHVDEARAGASQQHFVGFGGRQRTFVGELQFARARLCELQDFVQASHGRPLASSGIE
jgi:hypothetical protein